MNENYRKQAKQVFSSQHLDLSKKKEGINFLLACIADRICPKCGQDIYSHEGVVDRAPGEPIFYMCLDCGWNDSV